MYSSKHTLNFRKHFLRCKKYQSNAIVEEIEEVEGEDIEEKIEFPINYSNIGSNNDLIESSMLNSYNLLINSKHDLLICRTCKYVIEEESIISHVSRNHRAIVDSKKLTREHELTFLEELNMISPLINSNLNIEEESEFIQGLNIYDGYQCLDCKYICLSEQRMKLHRKKYHQVENSTESNSNNSQNNTNVNNNLTIDNSNNNNSENTKKYEKCNVQTLFLQPEKRRYFRVKKSSRLQTPVESIDRESIERIFAKSEGSFNRLNNQVRTGHQFVSSFYTESNWTYIFEKFNYAEIESIVELKPEQQLLDTVTSIFEKGEKFSKTVNHHFNQLIENPLSK